METSIALLRGVNVGGNNKLPMAELRAALGQAGLQNVQTYIQSGNVIFQTPVTNQGSLAGLILDTLQQHFAITTTVVILSKAQLQSIRDANPYPDAPQLDKALQLYFLHQPTTAPKLEKLQSLKAESESYQLMRDCFYLLAPDGIGRSKLAAGAERALGVATTTRNWRSVNKLLELAS